VLRQGVVATAYDSPHLRLVRGQIPQSYAVACGAPVRPQLIIPVLKVGFPRGRDCAVSKQAESQSSYPLHSLVSPRVGLFRRKDVPELSTFTIGCLVVGQDGWKSKPDLYHYCIAGCCSGAQTGLTARIASPSCPNLLPKQSSSSPSAAKLSRNPCTSHRPPCQSPRSSYLTYRSLPLPPSCPNVYLGFEHLD
jgi:hypothetical protein